MISKSPDTSWYLPDSVGGLKYGQVLRQKEMGSKEQQWLKVHFPSIKYIYSPWMQGWELVWHNTNIALPFPEFSHDPK